MIGKRNLFRSLIDCNNLFISTRSKLFRTMSSDQITRMLNIRYLKHSTIKKAPTQGKKKQVKAKNVQQQEQKRGKFEIKPPKGTRDFHPHQMAIRRKVIDSIVQVFKKHGAVEIDTPIFQLKEVLTGKYGEDSKLIYDLQDQGGQKCSLRYDLTVPFARFMANNTNIQKIKRFHIGKVYRRDQPTITKGRFRQFCQCDFDIAGKYDSMIPDAEVIAIMQQILETVGIDQFLVKVNHRKILQIMINEAGCSSEMFKTICSSIDKLDKMPWQQVRKELIEAKGVTQQQADLLGTFTKYKGQPQKLVQQLRQKSKDLFAKNVQKINQILNQMEKLCLYLTSMNRITKVSFDLSLARGLDYYTGIIYEIVLTEKNNELGSISGGGRYDGLIGMFCQYEIPAVGGSLGIQRIFNILQQKHKETVKQNECQVLVSGIRKTPVQAKFGILADLWANNIKAEMQYVQDCKPDKQIKHAFKSNIPMILWVGEDELKSGNLKLKILYKNQQVIVSAENIGKSTLKYVQQFRQDFKQGKVSFQDPNKKGK